MVGVGTTDWTLPSSEVPRWLPALDWVRRHAGYRLRLGQRLNAVVSRRLPATFDTRLLPGVSTRVDFRQDVARSVWWLGRRYEWPTADVILRWLDQGADHFFDIGANCGYFSYLAHSQSDVNVHAFEPNSLLCRQLETTKMANGMQRLSVHAVGLSSETGVLPLHVAEADTGWSTFGPHPHLTEETVPVPLVPFDEWRRDAGIALPVIPRWVAKIDVEGFEGRVLRGMSEALSAKAFLGLVVELNPYTLQFCDSSTAEVLGLLDEAGYKMVTVRGEERILNRFFVPA